MESKINIHDDVDKAIHNICTHIEKITTNSDFSETHEIAETAKALAVLVTTRASLNRY